MLRRFYTNQRGQSLVELALIFPFLLLVLAIALDLGRVYYFQISLTSAVREAARVAGVQSSNDAQIRQVIYDAVGERIELTDDSISITPAHRSSGDPVEVRVTYDFKPVTPMLAKLLDPDEVNGGALEILVKSVAVVQ